MLHKRLVSLIMSAALYSCGCLYAFDAPSPPDGIVPDEVTATRLAEIIMFRHFGERATKGQRPYRVTLKDGIWYIRGTVPEEAFGEEFYIHIRQRDGCVLEISFHE